MTPEDAALIAFLDHTGIPHKVTATTEGVHAPGSYHYRGLAVDFAGPVPASDSAILLSIFVAFTKIEGQLAELIYAGAPYQIKHGKHVSASFYGSVTMAAHHNHVHVAVEPGFRWTPTTAKVTPMYSPPLSIVASLEPAGGGVWLLQGDGAIFSFGGAQYKGGANQQPYFVGRTAARLEPNGAGYTIIDTAGERYDYP